ncbi:MAG: hypothetical protein AAF653_10585 [Chloroflexota bacterium]
MTRKKRVAWLSSLTGEQLSSEIRRCRTLRSYTAPDSKEWANWNTKLKQAEAEWSHRVFGTERGDDAKE